MKYIRLFENSDLRNAYENGNDYIEPYVSYTPVINKYEAQFNGETVDEIKVEKIQGGYKISIPEDEIEEEVLTNSNSFYYADPFIFPEDLNLTEESTEFVFNGNTFYLEYYTNNRWNVYMDSGHTQLGDLIIKFDIVSVSLPNTDAVHYNKIPPAKSIYAEIFIENVEKLSKKTSPLYVTISNRDDIFEKIIIDNGADIIDFSALEEQTKVMDDPNVYYLFDTYGTHKIEYVLKDEYAGVMPSSMIPSNSVKFNEITLPKGIYKIESNAFSYIHVENSSDYVDLSIPDTVTVVENCAVTCTNINSEAEDFLTSINPGSICNNCK